MRNRRARLVWRRWYWWWQDVRHWEIWAGPLTVYRWHPGAPCSLVNPQRHPLHVSIAARRFQ